MATSRIAEKMAGEGDVTALDPVGKEVLNMDEGNITALGPTDEEVCFECT
jgi:hypothetical protein